jgi:hypothetical protein
MSNIQKITALKGEYNLTETERLGDPQAVALEILHTQTIKEDVSIGPPRASGLYDACMRKHVLGTKLRSIETRWTGFGSRMTFGIGNAIHDWAQNTPEIFGDKIRGFWECMGCGETDFKAFGTKPKTRCSCGANVAAYKYREFGAHIKEPIEFTMHADMFIESNSFYRIVEIKTINGKDFDSLICPLAQHEYQVSTYVLGALMFKKKLFPNFDPKIAYLLYVSKQHKQRELPIKMFPVKITTETLDRIVGKLKIYKEGIKKYPKELPACDKKCRPPVFDSYIAKSCPLLKVCKEFELKR